MDGGDVVVDVNAHEPMDCEEAYAGRVVFLPWLLNVGFPRASHAFRWVRTKIGERGEIDLRDIARRELAKAYASHEPDHPAEHARGASAVASSWIAGLILLSGIVVEIPDRNTDDADWLLRRVDDEFHAASHTIARESGDFVEDCGAMPLLEHTSKEDEEFIGDRVGELKKDSQAHRSPPWWGCQGAPQHRTEAGYL